MNWSVKDERRFKSKVNKHGPVSKRLGTECWVWIASRIQNAGYGQFQYGPRIGRISVLAHRFSMMMVLKRSLLEEEHVLHHCDNHCCVRPSHLFVGTEKENKADMVEKDRQAKGEGIVQSKLTADNVRTIKKEYQYKHPLRGSTALARRFRVHHSTILRIVKGYQWNHVH